MIRETILADPTDSELAQAVQDNLFALFRAMIDSLGGELEERAGLARHLAFPSNPMFKGAWRSRLSADQADGAIDETIAWFKSRNAPFFFWWTGPGTTPDNLAERLAAHGLISMEEQAAQLAPGIHMSDSGAPGMAADLNRMNESALTRGPPGFSMEDVQDEASLLDFKRVLIEGYEIPDPVAQAWVDAAMRVGIGRTPWRMVLGRLDGRPVATNILLNGAGVAGVYGIATVPEARGKGIGAAITLKPLIDARDQGYRHAVLFSTEMGVRVYERIGFRLTGARIKRYLWRNS